MKSAEANTADTSIVRVSEFPRTTSMRTTLRWYDSVFFRVILLSAVLLLCLLGSIVFLTAHYFDEAFREMQEHAAAIAQSVTIELEQKPEVDVKEIEGRIRQRHRDVDLTLEPCNDAIGATSVTLERDAHGNWVRIARVPVTVAGRRLLVCVKMTLVPQTEVLRALQNKYMFILIGGFVLALGIMVYLMFRTLRPLSQLTDACAALPQGNYARLDTQGAFGEVRVLEETFNQMIESLKEKERMETELRRSQRLSALGNLAAGVAHDVRNPLNSIKLLSSHALDSLNGHNGTLRKALTQIGAEVERIEAIVNNFLFLAKERKLQRTPCDLASFLSESVLRVLPLAEQRNVHLSLDPPEYSISLNIDRTELQRALVNVLTNAIEACEEGGSVRVFTRLNGDTCEIEIRDNGIGITPEVREHLFDPYFTTKSSGTGLGLAIARSIIEEHGGSISLDGTPHVGSQAIIRLPLAHDMTESLRPEGSN